jgi:ribosomal protein S18 acetylase RimI-like enzyme
MITIRKAEAEDIRALYDLYRHIGKKDDGYFEKAMEQCDIFMAFSGEKLCAFCLLNWEPRYSLYRRLSIPEIQDLNVLVRYRRKGIASLLIKECEDTARAKECELIGISVGLGKDYGAAQILYTKLGYIPDGNGVTYDREGVHAGKSYPIDDNLSLMMTKTL